MHFPLRLWERVVEDRERVRLLLVDGKKARSRAPLFHPRPKHSGQVLRAPSQPCTPCGRHKQSRERRRSILSLVRKPRHLDRRTLRRRDLRRAIGVVGFQFEQMEEVATVVGVGR